MYIYLLYRICLKMYKIFKDLIPFFKLDKLLLMMINKYFLLLIDEIVFYDFFYFGYLGRDK
jgi:hypothetical protein